jgi:hypothetical protein
LDPLPQGLKPAFGGELHGAAEAAPFQNTIERDTAKAAPFKNAIEPDRVRLEGTLFQSKLSNQSEDSNRSVESVSPRPKAKTA